jgi:hypothetical protein
MAVTNRNTLVLANVSVVRDVVTSTMGLGTANLQPASPISMRHLSQRYPHAGQEPGLRQPHADLGGMDLAADRAGRPGCSSGVFARRSPASFAGAPGGSEPTSAWCLGRITAGTRAAVAKMLPERPWFSRMSRKHAEAGVAWLKPAAGALEASTRGIGSR